MKLDFHFSSVFQQRNCKKPELKECTLGRKEPIFLSSKNLNSPVFYLLTPLSTYSDRTGHNVGDRLTPITSNL